MPELTATLPKLPILEALERAILKVVQAGGRELPRRRRRDEGTGWLIDGIADRVREVRVLNVRPSP